MEIEIERGFTNVRIERSVNKREGRMKRSSRKRKKEKWRLGKMNYGKWTLRFMLSRGKFNPIRSN